MTAHPDHPHAHDEAGDVDVRDRLEDELVDLDPALRARIIDEALNAPAPAMGYALREPLDDVNRRGEEHFAALHGIAGALDVLVGRAIGDAVRHRLDPLGYVLAETVARAHQAERDEDAAPKLADAYAVIRGLRQEVEHALDGTRDPALRLPSTRVLLEELRRRVVEENLAEVVVSLPHSAGGHPYNAGVIFLLDSVRKAVEDHAR